MVYSADNPEDNFQHSQFHRHFLESIKFVVKLLYSIIAGLLKFKLFYVLRTCKDCSLFYYSKLKYYGICF